MAGPNIDSSKGIANTIPAFGPGSKTPVADKENTTELGGAGTVKPTGLPGAPTLNDGGGGGDLPSFGGPPVEKESPDELAKKDLLLEAVPTLIEDISDGLGKNTKDTNVSIEKLVNHLLDIGWTPGVLKSMIRKSKLESKEFFEALVKKINSSEDEAIKFLKEKISPQEGALAGAPTEAPLGNLPMGGPAGGPNLPPLAPEESALTSKANISDVYLDKTFNIREAIMGTKIVVKEGTLQEVPDNTNNVLNNLVVAIRKTKSAINSFEDEKLKYAGAIALKRYAMGEEEGDMESDPMGDIGDMGDEDMEDEDLGDLGDDEESDDFDKEGVLSGLDAIKDGIKQIEDAIKGVESEIEGPGEMGAEELGLGSDMIDEGEKTVATAKEILKTAKKDIKGLSDKNKKKDKKKDKKKSKGTKNSKDPMFVAMGGSGKKACEGSGKKEKEEEEEEEEGKEAHESLIKRVKARLANMRKEKEAQLYPFKDISGPAAKVDNTNAENASQQISAINSEITGQPVTDKDNPTINSELGQKDLPYKQEGKSTTGKNIPPATSSKISMETAEKTRAHSIKNAVDKAKLSVELAAQQQLKGLLDNPLKRAFVENMKVAGIPEDTAEAIAHNAFVDGYEANQQVIMKEAFETFMSKPIDDFVKVAKFTKEHNYKEASALEITEDDSREKTGSVNPPLRGAQVSDAKKDTFTKYWEQVGRERRGF